MEKVTVMSAVKVSSVKSVGVLLSLQLDSFDEAISVMAHCASILEKEINAAKKTMQLAKFLNENRVELFILLYS